MANKIYMDTELLEQLSSQLSQLRNSLSSVHQRLEGSVAELRRVVSDQTGMINKAVTVQKNTGKVADHTERLAKAVRDAAAKWEEAEKRVAGQQLPEAETAQQREGVGAVIQPDADSAGWFKYHYTPWDEFLKNPLKYFNPGWNLMSVIGESVVTDGIGGTIYKFLTGKISEEHSLAGFEAGYGDFFVKGDVFGGSVKTKGKASWDIGKGEFGATTGLTAEAYLAQLEAGYRGKYGELTSKATVGGTSVKGEIGATLFSGGKFDPQLYAKLKGEAYVYRSEVSGKLGTEDLNLSAKKEKTALGAEGEVKAGFIRDDDGNKKLAAKASGEAYLAKGKISGGIDIFGIKIGATGEAMVGVNGTVGAEVGTDSAQGEIGLGPFKVKVNVDWSGFAKRFL